MTRSFPRATRPFLNGLANDLRPLFDTSFTWYLRVEPGAVLVFYAGPWGGVDTNAVASAIASADEDTEKRRARETLESDIPLRVLARYIGQLHGKTPAAVRSDLRSILQNLS